MSEIVATPKPPYFAVIFTSVRTSVDEGYDETMDRMSELAPKQPGFLGLESARDPESCFGITVVYWESLEAIDGWRNHLEHIEVKKQGCAQWYESYKIRISRVESDKAFTRKR